MSHVRLPTDSPRSHHILCLFSVIFKLSQQFSNKRHAPVEVGWRLGVVLLQQMMVIPLYVLMVNFATRSIFFCSDKLNKGFQGDTFLHSTVMCEMVITQVAHNFILELLRDPCTHIPKAITLSQYLDEQNYHMKMWTNVKVEDTISANHIDLDH